MNGPNPTPIKLTDRQRAILEHIVRCSTSAQRLVIRARIILAGATGTSNQQIARQLGIERNVAAKWRRRWAAAADKLSALEAKAGADKDLREEIERLLADASRPGTPAKFRAEEIVKIVAVACEDPHASGRPITNWTPRELAEEVVQRQIVKAISSRSVGRFLKMKSISSPTSAVIG
jgi:putative transposase